VHGLHTFNFKLGPRNWFGIGGLLAVWNADPIYPHVALAKLAKKYGHIMFIKLGVNPTGEFHLQLEFRILFNRT